MSLDDFLDGAIDLALIITLILIVAGCVSTPVTKVVDLPQYHPIWPAPYTVCNVDWEIVLNEEGWPVVGIPYPQNLDLKACNKDKTRYIKQMTNILCHYRPKDDKHCAVQEKDPL